MPTPDAVARRANPRGEPVGRCAGGSLHRTLAALAFGISLLALSVTNAIDAIEAGSTARLLLATLPIAMALLVLVIFRLDGRNATRAGPSVDALTGLPDRRTAMRFLAAEMSTHTGRPPAIVLFDLDRFSAFARENGRAAANGVLRAFSTILREQTRRANLSARIGNDRFLAVLRDATRDDAVTFAARVHERFRGAAETAALPTASIGIACELAYAADAQEMVALAEQALSAAKLEGGDRIRVEGGSRSSGPRQDSAERADPLRARAGETVLVVEDDASIRELSRRILIDAGYRVLTAADGKHAIDTLASHAEPIHLVLSDVVMPRVNGRELATHIVHSRPETRILLMSGFIDDPVLETSIRTGALPFISKPFTRDSLLGKLREVLD